MNELNLEQVRAAMFTDPGVKAVDDLRLVAGEHGRAIAATITAMTRTETATVIHNPTRIAVRRTNSASASVRCAAFLTATPAGIRARARS